MQKHIIVVANPDKIPGGLETVRVAASKYLPPERFDLVPCEVGPVKIGRKKYPTMRQADAMRDAARALHPNANLYIAFASRIERVTWGKETTKELVRLVSTRSKCGHTGKPEWGSCSYHDDPTTADPREIVELFGHAMSIDLKRVAEQPAA